jgi:hypothetical protein
LFKHFHRTFEGFKTVPDACLGRNFGRFGTKTGRIAGKSPPADKLPFNETPPGPFTIAAKSQRHACAIRGLLVVVRPR